LKWFPAAKGAGVLPFPSRVQSLDWSSHPWVNSGIGEVYQPGLETERPSGRAFNGAEEIKYAVGVNPCADPRWFTSGEPVGEVDELQEYNDDGLPTCCFTNFETHGLILLGGATSTTWTPAPPPAGNTCETAGLFAIGQTITGTLKVNETQVWRVDNVGPANYKIEFLPPTTIGAQLTWYVTSANAPPCGNQVVLVSKSVTVACATLTQGGFSPSLVVSLSNALAVPFPFAFRITVGACPP
jgi:hypothetical protein